jgi:hypothetical protein
VQTLLVSYMILPVALLFMAVVLLSLIALFWIEEQQQGHLNPRRRLQNPGGLTASAKRSHRRTRIAP